MFHCLFHVLAERSFQQDGAPPHFDLPIWGYLNQIFSLHWFGRRGSIEEPSRSFNLTLNDFIFFGGGVLAKNKVYVRNPHTFDELIIYLAFTEIDADRYVCRAVCHIVLEVFKKYCNVKGGHFVHLDEIMLKKIVLNICT